MQLTAWTRSQPRTQGWDAVCSAFPQTWRTPRTRDVRFVVRAMQNIAVLRVQKEHAGNVFWWYFISVFSTVPPKSKVPFTTSKSKLRGIQAGILSLHEFMTGKVFRETNLANVFLEKWATAIPTPCSGICIDVNAKTSNSSGTTVVELQYNPKIMHVREFLFAQNTPFYSCAFSCQAFE